MPKAATAGAGAFRARSILTSDAALVILGIVIISAAAGALSENFLTYSNFESVTKSQTIIAVMAMGQLLVLITGGIDISIGSTFGLAGSITALMLAGGYSPVSAIAVSLAMGLVVGLFTGFVIAKLSIAPFIVTLGVMGIVRGLNYIVADAQSISIANRAFLSLESGRILGVPLPFIIAVAACVITHYFLTCSVLGGRIFAIGGDEDAARMLGVKTGSVKVFCYVVSGFTAAVGGVMSAAKVEAAYPQAGGGYEFEVIASCIVGGTAISGGKGTALAAMLGALFIGLLKNAIVQVNISQYWQQAVNGFAIILVIMISTLLSRRR